MNQFLYCRKCQQRRAIEVCQHKKCTHLSVAKLPSDRDECTYRTKEELEELKTAKKELAQASTEEEVKEVMKKWSSILY